MPRSLWYILSHMATSARRAVLLPHEKIVRDDGAIVALVICQLPRATPGRPYALKRDGPLSINELARRLARHYKNVHTDVTRLAGLGLIERRSDQRVEVVWDIVAAEMRLAA